MKRVKQVLKSVEESIKNTQEYGYFLTHSVRYFFILKTVQELAQGRKLVILDIGCFPYHIGKALEILGHKVYGISSDHEPIENKRIKVINIEKDKFPFQADFFDLVLMSEVIEHLPQSPLIALSEINRILKKGGYVFITTPNIARSINRVKLLVGKTIMYSIDVYFENNGKGSIIYHRHNREYTLGELHSLLKRTFLKDIKSGFFISYTPIRKRIVPDAFLLKFVKYINYFLMICIDTLKDTIYIVGEK